MIMRTGTLRACGVLTLLLALALPAMADDDDEDSAEFVRKIHKKIEKALKKAQEDAEKAREEAEEARLEDEEEAREDAREQREKAEREARKVARAEAEAEEARLKAERKARKVAREEARDKPYAEADAADKGERKAIRKFREEAREYASLHLKLEEKLQKLQQDAPRTVLEHERALGAAIRARRAGARQGDVFVPESQPFFKQRIEAELAGPEGAPARKAVREGNPRTEVDVHVVVSVAVNAPYPLSSPVSTVPPSVLLQLPALPGQLEYRFVGRDLVLRDTTANLIVDFIPQAAPPLTAH
jgi:hypothetical protein